MPRRIKLTSSLLFYDHTLIAEPISKVMLYKYIYIYRRLYIALKCKYNGSLLIKYFRSPRPITPPRVPRNFSAIYFIIYLR